LSRGCERRRTLEARSERRREVKNVPMQKIWTWTSGETRPHGGRDVPVDIMSRREVLLRRNHKSAKSAACPESNASHCPNRRVKGVRKIESLLEREKVLEHNWIVRDLF
jgi:hypothetical protein